jgi:hypothetical protein
VSAPLIFPDVAEIAVKVSVAGLDALGLSVPVGTRVPSPRPPEFVRISRAGGTRRNLVTEDARIAVEAWAQAAEDAADLAEAVRSILHSIRGTVVDGVPIYRVDDAEGLADDPDALSDQPRYQFALSLTVRGRKPEGGLDA